MDLKALPPTCNRRRILFGSFLLRIVAVWRIIGFRKALKMSLCISFSCDLKRVVYFLNQ